MLIDSRTLLAALFASRPVRATLFAVIFFVLLPVCGTSSGAARADEPVRIGVLAKRGAAQTVTRWLPTADYLSKSIPGRRFVIVPIDFDQVYAAAANGTVDFLLVNSGIYVELEKRYGIGRIATMRNLGPDGRVYTRFGGVIFTRADRSDLNSLSQLRGRRFAAVEDNSFGGFLAAMRELLGSGIDPYHDFAELRFTGTHDAVVKAVLAGEADAGTVRTDTLEAMAAEQRLDLRDIRVIGGRDYPDFRLRVSTALYPEWPFAKLEGTDEVLSDQVASALLAMPAQSDAARASRTAGWTVPHNYQPVHDLMRELKIGPYQFLGEIRIGEIVRQHWGWMLAIGVAVTALLLSYLNVLTLNRRLRHSDEALRQARDNLADKVRERTAELEESNRRLDLALREWNEAFDAIKDPIFIHDESMRIVHANPAYAQRAGVPGAELVGRVYHELFPRLPQPLAACRNFPETIHDEGEEIALADGEVFVSRSFGIRRADGSHHNAIHILEDVTAVRQSEARRRTLSRAVEEAREGMVILDAAHRVVYCNPAFCHLFGRKEALIRGQDLGWLFGSDALLMQERIGAGSWAGELILTGSAGAVPVFLTIGTIHATGGGVEGYVVSCSDLTALKQAREAVQYRLRFESVIGSIAARFLATDGTGIDLELGEALVRLGEFVEMDRAYLVRCRDGEEWAHESHSWYRAGVMARPLSGLDLERLGWLQRHLKNAEIVHVGDVGQLPEEAAAERRFLVERAVRSAIYVPMIYRGEVIGSIVLEVLDRATTFPVEDIRLLRTAAEIIANAVRRHEAEEAVRASQVRLKEAQRIARFGNWEWDVATNRLFWSDVIYSIFGVNPREFGATYDAFLGYVHPDDHERVVEAVNRAIDGHQPLSIDHRIVRRDGSERIVHQLAEVSYGGDGEPLRMAGTVQDVTETRRAEAEMRRLNRALRTLSLGNATLVHASDELQLLRDVCTILTEAGGYRFAWVGYPQQDAARSIKPMAWAGSDPRFLDCPGFSWGDGALGQGPIGTASRERRAIIVHDIAGDTAFIPWREAAMKLGYASMIALPLLDGDELIGTLCIAADAGDAFDVREQDLLTELAADLAFGLRSLRTRSERERAIRALHASEQRYHELYDAAPTGYASVDALSGCVLQCNAAFAELLGYPRDELMGRPVAELYADTPAGKPRAQSVFARFVQGQRIRDEELQMQHREGRPIWISLSVEPVFDGEGRVVESRSSVIDISARKLVEAERQQFAARLERSLIQTIQAIALTIEKRDPYTAGHQQRVAELASAIAAELGVSDQQAEGLRLGALIHDIGKVYVPTEILNRPSTLDPPQLSLVRTHPQVGFDIVCGIDFPWPLADMVVQHHERLDGSGYPQGLKGDQILLEARILAVADVVEAMVSHRPYRPALPLEAALAEIEQHRIEWFDPGVVDACVRLFRERGFQWSGSGDVRVLAKTVTPPAATVA